MTPLTELKSSDGESSLLFYTVGDNAIFVAQGNDENCTTRFQVDVSILSNLDRVDDFLSEARKIINNVRTTEISDTGTTGQTP